MFCTFTTEHGALILRTQDIRALADRADGCVVTWEVAGDVYNQTVQGTARDNLDRLKAEELAAVAEAQRLQQRVQPALPIQRGRVR